MKGKNLALKENQFILESRTEMFSAGNNKPCIFISYQREDEQFAISVADFIQEKGINIYLDIEDRLLDKAKEEDNAEEVNKCILKGLSVCEEMLILLSNTTLDSVWVPFEVGYGYAREKTLNILKHKDISIEDLPSYLDTVSKITDSTSFKNYLNGFPRVLTTGSRKMTTLKSFVAYSLSDVLDDFLDK